MTLKRDSVIMPQLHEIMFLAPKYRAAVFKEPTARESCERLLKAGFAHRLVLSTFPSTLPVNAFEHRLLNTFQESLHFCIKHEIVEARGACTVHRSRQKPSIPAFISSPSRIYPSCCLSPRADTCHGLPLSTLATPNATWKERKIFKVLLCTACFVRRGLLTAQSRQSRKTSPGIQNHSSIKDKENGAEVNKQQQNDKSPQLVLHIAGSKAGFGVRCNF